MTTPKRRSVLVIRTGEGNGFAIPYDTRKEARLARKERKGAVERFIRQEGARGVYYGFDSAERESFVEKFPPEGRIEWDAFVLYETVGKPSGERVDGVEDLKESE